MRRSRVFDMRIALIGADGQLGTALSACLSGDVILLRHRDIEITDAENVHAVLADAEPDAVINAAAYNRVDQAEDEPATAFAVNALGPRHLAQFCATRDVPLLHVSTDYVFGLETNRNTPYTETDAPGPVNAYGVSKLAGESFVRSLCRRHFVVRTCGLYGRRSVPDTQSVRDTSSAKGNFVETMLTLAAERDELQVVNDQICTPTSAADVARAIAALIETDAYGLYHATNTGSTSWFDFARDIFRFAEVEVRVKPISSAQFGAKARRPAYSVLDCGKLTNLRGEALPAWQEALAAYLASRMDEE